LKNKGPDRNPAPQSHEQITNAYATFMSNTVFQLVLIKFNRVLFIFLDNDTTTLIQTEMIKYMTLESPGDWKYDIKVRLFLNLQKASFNK
jgi:hypothetical protein